MIRTIYSIQITDRGKLSCFCVVYMPLYERKQLSTPTEWMTVSFCFFSKSAQEQEDEYEIK
jgi:hypothetical protein